MIDDSIAALRTGKHELYPPATQGDISQTESALGRALPSSFKTFVSTYSNGAYLYGTQEVSAIGTGSQQILPIQNIRLITEGDEKEYIPLDTAEQIARKNLIPFSLDHNANAWCFLADSQDECRVAYFDTSGQKLYCALPSFAAWLEILVKHQDEVIRMVCDPETLMNEIGLG